MKLKILALLLLLGLLSGCIVVAAAAGAGAGVMYVQGATVKSFPYDVEHTRNAVVAALEAENIVVTMKNHDHSAGKVTGAAADGKKVIIDLKAKGDGVTEVKVRVGALGNRERSAYIMGKITQRI